jgi:hypothetical protein
MGFSCAVQFLYTIIHKRVHWVTTGKGPRVVTRGHEWLQGGLISSWGWWLLCTKEKSVPNKRKEFTNWCTRDHISLWELQRDKGQKVVVRESDYGIDGVWVGLGESDRRSCTFYSSKNKFSYISTQIIEQRKPKSKVEHQYTKRVHSKKRQREKQ